MLRPPYLLYFSRRGDAKEKGVVHLFQARFQLNPHLAHTFLIHNQTRSYHFQAASDKEMKSWLRSMASPAALEQLGLPVPNPQLNSPTSPTPRRKAAAIAPPHKRTPSITSFGSG